jgi:hypothetical protein
MSSNERETTFPRGSSWKHSGGKARLHCVRVNCASLGGCVPGEQHLTYLSSLVSRPRTGTLDHISTTTHCCTEHDLAQLEIALDLALGGVGRRRASRHGDTAIGRE